MKKKKRRKLREQKKLEAARSRKERHWRRVRNRAYFDDCSQRHKSGKIHQAHRKSASIEPPSLTHPIDVATMERAFDAYLSIEERARYKTLRDKIRSGESLDVGEDIEYRELRRRARRFRKAKKKPGLHLTAFKDYMDFVMKAHYDTLRELHEESSSD